MNNLSKKIVDEEGKKETVIASSTDNYTVKLDNNYKLSNHIEKKESKLAKKFKGTILGADIGVKSNGFSSIAVLAAVIAIAVLAVLYFVWRF